MGINMKLNDKRTFLLGGAFLLFLLLFAMMSSVAAADDISQVVCENCNNNSSLNAEINNADVMEFNNTDDEIVIENVIRDVVVISNSSSAVCIVNSAINTIIIKNSEIYDFIIENSTIDSAIIEKSNLYNLTIKNSKIYNLTLCDSNIVNPNINNSNIYVLTVRNSTYILGFRNIESVGLPTNASVSNGLHTTPEAAKKALERAKNFREECKKAKADLGLIVEMEKYLPGTVKGANIGFTFLGPLGVAPGAFIGFVYDFGIRPIAFWIEKFWDYLTTPDDNSSCPCNDSKKITRSHMVGGGVIVPSFIEVIFNKDCNYPDEIHGWDGSTVHFTAAVKTYEFFWIYSDPIGNGTLSLLKDGKVIDVKDLSENSNPTFSLKIEKGHRYSLKYEGGYSQESSWYYYHYEPSSKTLDVHYKDDYWLWKG